MNTSLKWIKDLVPGLDCTPQEYMDAMTLSGSKVEGYENMDEDLDKIVIGQVKSIEKHPDADKLVICQVDIGTETIQIVTGAPNVTEGCKVPVVLDGGKVAGGHPQPAPCRRKGQFILRYARACGRQQAHTAEPQKCTVHHVFQRGYFVCST